MRIHILAMSVQNACFIHTVCPTGYRNVIFANKILKKLEADVRESKCLWGQMPMVAIVLGADVLGAVLRVADVMGQMSAGGECRWGRCPRADVRWEQMSVNLRHL